MTYLSGEQLGARCRELRQALGLSIQDVADRAGCTRSYVWEIEAGKRSVNPTLSMLAGFARAFGVSIAELISPEIDPAQSREFMVSIGTDAMRLALGMKPKTHTAEDVIRFLQVQAEHVRTAPADAEQEGGKREAAKP